MLRVSKIIIIILTLKRRTPQPRLILKIKATDLSFFFFYFIKDEHTSQISNYMSTSLPIIITFLPFYILDEKTITYSIVLTNYSGLQMIRVCKDMLSFSKNAKIKIIKRHIVVLFHYQDLKIISTYFQQIIPCIFFFFLLHSLIKL